MSTDTELRNLLEGVVGKVDLDVHRSLRDVEVKAARTSRRRRGVTLAAVLAVVAIAVGATVTLQRDHDPSVATPTRSVEVKRHVGAGGQVFGPLVGPSGETLTAAQYEAEPDLIAVFADSANGVEPVGYVKRSDALFQNADGTYAWSDNFLDVYGSDGATVVGQFVGHHSFLAFVGRNETRMSPATLEAGAQPSRAWYDQLVASCAAQQEAAVNGPNGQPSSATSNGMVGVYDHATGIPIQMPIAQFCSEVAALSPDPAGNLTAGFTVENGHVTATYRALNRIVENGAEIARAGEVVPFDEAQRIIAAQRKSAHSF